MGFRVWRFGVLGFGFREWNSGFRFRCSGFVIPGIGFRGWG